jgi:hypothetical protein
MTPRILMLPIFPTLKSDGSACITAHSEEILPLSEQRGATGPDNALL